MSDYTYHKTFDGPCCVCGKTFHVEEAFVAKSKEEVDKSGWWDGVHVQVMLELCDECYALDEATRPTTARAGA